MVSSTLNPNTFIKEKQVTPDKFGNFMVGSSFSNSSPITEAANKIVEFSSPNVSTLPSNISNLLSTISTNILNQVDNSLKNTTNLLSNDYETKLSNLQIQLKSRLLDIEGRISPLESKVNDLTNVVDSIQKSINDLDKEVMTGLKEQSNQIVSLSDKINSNIDKDKISNTDNSVTKLQNVVNSIQDRVKSVLTNTLRNFTQDYQKKIKGFDDNRPNEVLSKFTVLYKNAIGFINFFGNKSNIEVVNKNLKALRNMFEESFEVAKLVRQTITKIVKQLSNLPSASPSSGGLNLDINVPGGRLKQSAGPSVKNIGRGGRMGGILGGGLGLLGLGGAATALSGMSKAKEYQESMLSDGVSPVMGEQYFPEAVVDLFSQIIDKFTASVDDLINGAKSFSGVGGELSEDGGGGPSTQTTNTNTNTTSTSSASGSSATSGTPEQKALLDSIASAEGTTKSYGTMFGGGVNKDFESGNLTVKQVIDLGDEHARKNGRSGASGRYQFMPPTLEGLVKMGVLKMDEKFTPELQDKAALALAERRGVTAEMLKREGLSQRVSDLLAPEWASFPYSPKGGKSYYGGQPSKTLKEVQAVYNSSLQSASKIPKIETTEVSPTSISTQTSISSDTSNKMQASRVEPAPTKSQSTQAKAQAISQPAQKAPTTVSLPPTIIDASQPQQSQGGSSGGGSITPPASSGGGQIEVPMLPTGNPDNFLTMYSRIVYNIVDG